MKKVTLKDKNNNAILIGQNQVEGLEESLAERLPLSGGTLAGHLQLDRNIGGIADVNDNVVFRADGVNTFIGSSSNALRIRPKEAHIENLATLTTYSSETDSTFNRGSAGQVLMTNGNRVYWGEVSGGSIYEHYVELGENYKEAVLYFYSSSSEQHTLEEITTILSSRKISLYSASDNTDSSNIINIDIGGMISAKGDTFKLSGIGVYGDDDVLKYSAFRMMIASTLIAKYTITKL